MLLLDTASLELCEFGGDAPPYATFSARWEDRGLVQEDLCSPQTAPQRPAFQSLQRACSECQSRGLQWLWNDAVCIRRSSSSALSESLNSLAEIYRKARLCIVYLQDLLDTEAFDFDLESALSSCSWMKHVWMLPHLIFSTVLHFYDAQWKHIGSKSELVPELSRITSVDEGVLQHSDSLEDYSNSTKMSWAAGLSADPIEDAAYSLLAIFNVNLDIKYGEGMKSFLRLQEEILQKTDDYSLLAWQPLPNQPYRGLLAHSPLEYSHFKNQSMESPSLRGNLEIQSDGIYIQAGLGGRGNDLLLPLYTSQGPTMWIVLSLWDGIFVRNCIETVVDGAEISNVFIRNICVRRDVSTDLSNRIATHRVSPEHKQISTRGRSRESSISDRMIQHDTANSCTAWSADAVNSEVAHTLTREAKGGRCSFGLLGWGTNCLQKALPGSLSPTPSHACDATDGESPRSSPDSKGDWSNPGSPLALEPGHPFAAVTGYLKTILVERFLAMCNSRPGKRALLTWPQRSRKRPRLAWSEPYMDVELASDSEDVDTVVVHHASARASTFACPFYLMDKARHETCLTRHSLSNIDEVKEHLWASHRRPNFCPICKDTFDTMKARDDHIRSRNCEHRNLPTFDGLTDGQIQQLARQGSPPASRESQWYALWDVVFPSGPRPLSPYYSTAEEFLVVALRRFWETNGRSIISDFLREKGLQGWEVSDEERSLAILYRIVLHDAIDEVYRRFSGGSRDLEREQ
ncbi:hypothetical protein FJTKL_06805 [Diaporthe vaccinii]|uniref:Heterokaryon incompatibility domain-containing protein n=1 Tax=Diaporthe vaccinii TaxID=105482 RepID=A0ABR4EVH5_9PEZI